MNGLNKDDIIRMVKEAGISKPWDQEPVKWETLERFAKLVAAAEREACAKLCEQFYTESDAEFYRSEFASAIRARGQE